MSVKLMSKVWEIQLDHAKQSVLLALADHAHDDGTHCYPGVEYLSWKTGYSERQIQRILHDLADEQLIQIIAWAKGGRGLPTEFELHLDNGKPKPEWRKGDKMSPFRAKQKGDISGKKRVTFRAEKGDIFAQKGDISGNPPTPPYKAEPSENHKKLTTHTQPVRARDASPPPTVTPASEEQRVCVDEKKLPDKPGGGSRFTQSERVRYAKNHPEIRNAIGWAVKGANGQFDELVRDWLAQHGHANGNNAPPPQRDVSACPDCAGIGWWYPSGFKTGSAAKCRHPKLVEGSISTT